MELVSGANPEKQGLKQHHALEFECNRRLSQELIQKNKD